MYASFVFSSMMVKSPKCVEDNLISRIKGKFSNKLGNCCRTVGPNALNDKSNIRRRGNNKTLDRHFAVSKLFLKFNSVRPL